MTSHGLVGLPKHPPRLSSACAFRYAQRPQQETGQLGHGIIADRLGLAPPLTTRGVRELKARAAADLRTIGNYVSHLVVEELKRKNRRPLWCKFPSRILEFMTRLLTELPIDENVVCSPLGVRLALAMVLPGACGDTREELAGFLGTDAPASLAAIYRTLRADRGRARAIRLSVANGAFLQPRFPILPAYQKAVEGPFGALIENLDFSDAGSAAARINEWVGKATEGRISNLLAPGVLSQLTRLVLINAVYFFAEWAEPFKERLTRPERFYPIKGAAYDVPMMRQMGLLPYAVDDASGIEAVRIPYRATSLVVVLPRRDRFAGVAQSFGEDNVVDLRFSEREVELRLPRFELESRLSLAGVLSRLGVRLPFDRNRADFAALTDHPEGLFIEAVEHAARIRVDEQGTEAAAATAVFMGARGIKPMRPEPLPFHVNRPFLFFVYDDKKDCVLFAGRCPNPKAVDAP